MKIKTILVPLSWHISFSSFKMHIRDDPIVMCKTEQLCKIQEGNLFFLTASS